MENYYIYVIIFLGFLLACTFGVITNLAKKSEEDRKSILELHKEMECMGDDFRMLKAIIDKTACKTSEMESSVEELSEELKYRFKGLDSIAIQLEKVKAELDILKAPKTEEKKQTKAKSTAKKTKKKKEETKCECKCCTETEGL